MKISRTCSQCSRSRTPNQDYCSLCKNDLAPNPVRELVINSCIVIGLVEGAVIGAGIWFLTRPHEDLPIGFAVVVASFLGAVVGNMSACMIQDFVMWILIRRHGWPMKRPPGSVLEAGSLEAFDKYYEIHNERDWVVLEQSTRREVLVLLLVITVTVQTILVAAGFVYVLPSINVSE